MTDKPDLPEFPATVARTKRTSYTRKQGEFSYDIDVYDPPGLLPEGLACELRDDGETGVEVQISRDGAFLFGRRHTPRALELEETDERKAQYLREGGTLIA
jgi:hypothetical protein